MHTHTQRIEGALEIERSTALTADSDVDQKVVVVDVGVSEQVDCFAEVVIAAVDRPCSAKESTASRYRLRRIEYRV